MLWRNVDQKDKDLAYISHAILPALSVFRWGGRIFLSDIDPIVRKTVNTLNQRYNNDRQHLRIQPPGNDVRDSIPEYCAAYGASGLALWDADLTSTLEKGWDIIKPCVKTLREYDYKGRTYLTYALRNNQSTSYYAGLLWLDNQARALRAKVEWHDKYYSGSFDRKCVEAPGSAMAIVELQHY